MAIPGTHYAGLDKYHMPIPGSMAENKGYLSGLPVFFIVGRGRSGSTLLRTVLDAHPSLTVPAESRFVQYLYYRLGMNREWSHETTAGIPDLLEKGFEPPRIDRECFARLILEEKERLSFNSVCKALYLSIPSEFKKGRITCIGDKNPRYSFFIPVLLKIFPNAKFIHLVRDYRDNMLAVKRVHRTIGETGLAPVVISRWKYYNRIIEYHKLKLPGRFLTLRFEDLVLDPEKEVRRVCTFLDVPYDPVMLTYSVHYDPAMHGDSYAVLHKSLQNPFNRTKAGEWKTGLSPRQKVLCNFLAGKQASVYGYLPDGTHNSFWQGALAIVLAPVMFAGTLRYRFKNMLYRFPDAMRIAYRLIPK